MKQLGRKLLSLMAAISMTVTLAGGAVLADSQVVTPTNMDGWVEDSTPPADVEFVEGPNSPPLGAGSAEFSVDASGSTDAELRTAQYTGLRLDELTALNYSTFVQNNNNEQAVYIILNVDYDGDGASDDLLFFEPVYQDSTFCTNDQGNVLLDTWQTWDALNGCWWSVGGTAGATPGTGTKTLSQILAVEPDAAIATSTDPKGAVRLVAGFGGPDDWGNFLGNVDAFTVNTDTFDFELHSMPTSKDECKKEGWMTFNPPEGSFKNQGDCVSFVATDGRNQPAGSPAPTSGEVESTSPEPHPSMDDGDQSSSTQSSQSGRSQAPG